MASNDTLLFWYIYYPIAGCVNDFNLVKYLNIALFISVLIVM